MSFGARVRRILAQVEDREEAAALIEAVHDALELQRRQDLARTAARGRWGVDTGLNAKHDADVNAKHEASREVAKRLDSLPENPPSAPSPPVGGVGGGLSGILPGLSLAPDPSQPPKQKIRVRKSARALGPSPAFDAFWALYPRRVKKPAARRAWESEAPPLEAVTAALAWQVPLWTEPKYIPHPATWLNDRSWEDERPQTNGTNGHSGYFRAPHPGEFDYPEGEQKL